MLGRLAFFLLLGTLGVCAGALAFGWQIELDPATADRFGWREGMSDEEIVRADLAFHVNDRRATEALQDAVDRKDAEDAAVYLAIADDLGVPLAGALRAAAMGLEAREASAETQLADYASGFLTGEGDTIAGLAGAISGDLTVYGDLRDIVKEGGKMLAGEEYSELLLGLSVVGIAATTATVATGGGGVVARAGISFVKFAGRTGAMTASFAARLLKLTGEAVDMKAFRRMLAGINLTDPVSSWRAVETFAAGVKGARIVKVMGRLEEIRAAVGTAEALRLMKRMNRIEDVDDIHALVKVSGKRARGIMELTGKASLRAIKYVTNVLQIFLHYMLGFLLWIGALVAMIALRVTISAWRLTRAVLRWMRRRRLRLTAAPQHLVAVR